MLTSAVIYLAGFLVLFLSSGIRSCMPDMIISQGRDPSERRQAAFFHLGILWLMNFTGTVLAGAGSVLLAGILSPLVGLPFWVSFLALVMVSFLLAVILPSMIAMKNSPGLLSFLRLPYLMVSLLFRLPALLFFGGSSDDNPETVGWLITPPDVIWLERRREKGDPGEFEKEQKLMDSIIDFSDKIVREVMVPRIDMVCVEINADLSTVVDKLKRAGHSRIPVYEEKIDNIRGLLYAKDLLALLSDDESGFQLRSILRTPYFVPEYKRIDELMREFQSKRIHMAIVVDEYGGTAGLVTLEDIMEEVFGEILDEYDKEALLVKKLDSGSFILDARLPIDDLNSLLGTDFADDDFESLGGMVYQLMGKIPRPNERTEYSGYSFTVEQVRAQRILYVRVEPINGPGKETD
ncbi:MAG: HlyC/CorC family transporter [Candidatus Fermentibacteraceae bacterium]|nr:HlyC/CorC family transporter [Candidatus Fermentibacteraceae bacterium]